jgi:hypothetical protein
MAVHVFTIQEGKWVKKVLPDTEGWWNTVEATDLDGDGDSDLLLGNLGLNADLRATLEEPVELFVKDFDGNRKTDPILTYYKQGKRYTYASLDELSAQLVSLKKRYTRYLDFAENTFEDVFNPSMLEGAVQHQAVTFANSMAINQGNGRFELHELPRSAQLTPLYGFAAADIDDDSHTDILAVGNFYESIPALGRYDASFGHVLRGIGNGRFEEVPPNQSGLAVRGAMRDLRVISSPGGLLQVILAGNNGPVRVFEKRIRRPGD